MGARRPPRLSLAAAHRRDSITLGIAVGLVGATFGVLASAAGLSLAQAAVMSLLVFTGASQFAAVGVIEGGGSDVSAVGSALLLSARNALYGMRLSELLARFGRRRIAGAQLVIDESTAMALAQDAEQEAVEAFWLTGATVFVTWNASTIAGFALGQSLGDPDAWGLDAAFPASFVALLGPHVRAAPGRTAALAGAAIALVAVPFSPAGLPILLAVFGVVPALLVARRSPS